MAGKKLNISGIKRGIVNTVETIFSEQGFIYGLLAATVCLVGSLPIIGYINYSQASNKEDQLQEKHRQQSLVSNITRQSIESLDTNMYSIQGKHVIAVKDGGLTTLFNFREKYIAIDGPDEADSVIQFSDYEYSNVIEDTRKIGCKIAPVVLERGTSLKEQNSLTNVASRDKLERTISNHKIFLQKNCH